MSSREDQAQEGTVVTGAEEEPANRTFALDPGEGEAWWWMGGLATIKATGEQTDGRYSLVEVLVPEFPKEERLLHVHHFEDEGFYVLEGEMTFYVGDQTIKAHPGTFLFGPKDVPHAFTVESGPARLLFVLSPAGMEGLIREMGERARSLTVPPQPEESPDEAEMERLMAIAARYGGRCWDPRLVSRTASPTRGRAGPAWDPALLLPLFTRVRGRVILRISPKSA